MWLCELKIHLLLWGIDSPPVGTTFIYPFFSSTTQNSPESVRRQGLEQRTPLPIQPSEGNVGFGVSDVDSVNPGVTGLIVAMISCDYICQNLLSCTSICWHRSLSLGPHTCLADVLPLKPFHQLYF
jgi:hypothetical protein